MELTWTVPVALILAPTIYLVVTGYFRHKERMALARAAANPATAASLGARLNALEAEQRAREAIVRE